jgi:hypothetical protein
MAAKVDVQYIRFYTDGSAAKQVMPLFPEEKKARRARARKQAHRRVIYVDPVAIFSIAVAAALLVCMVVGLASLQQARQQNAQMLSYVQTLEQENERLQQTYAEGYDLQEIEKTALALCMVPAENVRNDAILVQMPAQEQMPSGWERFVAFLTGLFA